jgi:hypothetical protein
MFDFLGGGDDDVDVDDDFGADLAQATLVYCPYCGESVEMTLDASGGGIQEYVEDCEVCCQPWSVRVSIDQDGVPHVDVQALDE